MKTYLVVAGYIFSKNKVLLVHHSKLDLWLPPGGHIDKDETPDDALLREIKEELSMDVEVLNQSDISAQGNVIKNLALPFHVNVHSINDHNHCCFFYICKALNPENLKANHEIKNFEWFTREQLNQNHVPIDVRHMALKAFELIDKLE